MMKLKILKNVGLHPMSPRWLKIICLKIVMRSVVKKFAKHMESMTPEQRDKINAQMGRIQA